MAISFCLSVCSFVCSSFACEICEVIRYVAAPVLAASGDYRIDSDTLGNFSVQFLLTLIYLEIFMTIKLAKRPR